MNNNPILVVVAMEVEAKVLLEKITNIEEKTKYGYKFYEGLINDERIVILLSGVGSIIFLNGSIWVIRRWACFSARALR